jgi:hypothetical protein
MAQDFIFAQDVILDPDTGKVVAVVRNREVYRDGARIAVLVGAQMYDLNGNLLGQLAAGVGSLPMSFKNLLEGKSALGPRAVGVAMPRPAALRTFAGGHAATNDSLAPLEAAQRLSVSRLRRRGIIVSFQKSCGLPPCVTRRGIRTPTCAPTR